MSDLRVRLAGLLSPGRGGLCQFVKYAAVGVLATAVQTIFFYVLASTALKCLTPSDWAVRALGLPAVELCSVERSLRFCVCNVLSFLVSNVFCWIMNRLFVFRAGRHGILFEFVSFVSASALAMALATGISSFLIGRFGVTTTVAFALQIFVSFAVNFAARKFFVFKG